MVLALLGMFLIPTVIFRSLGAGAILVVIVAVVATLTLVPAMLSLLGDQIDWPRKRRLRRHDGRGAGDATTTKPSTPDSGADSPALVMARPVVSVVLAGGLLLAAALPYLDLNRGQSGCRVAPAE